MKRQTIDWSKVSAEDWKLRDRQLAAKLGCCPSAVWNARRRCGKLEKDRQHIDWLKVDWSKSSAVLANELGRSVQAVKYARLRMGAPAHADDAKRIKRKRHNRQTWHTWDWTQSNALLSRVVGISRERVRQIRRLLEVEAA